MRYQWFEIIAVVKKNRNCAQTVFDIRRNFEISDFEISRVNYLLLLVAAAISVAAAAEIFLLAAAFVFVVVAE